MRFLKRFFDFYINSSIHVALAVYSLSLLSLKMFNISYQENILYFIFYGTITGYNFVKYFGVAKFHHRSLTKGLKIIQVFSLICFVLMCYYLRSLQQNTLMLIAILCVITFFYAIPFLPKHLLVDKAMNLRAVSGLKIYVIAFVWSVVTVLLPLVEISYNITTDVAITFFQRFIYVLVIMLPFEIRDMQFDSVKLATIPQQIGIKRSKKIGVVLLIFFFFFEFFKDELKFQNVLSSLFILFLVTLSIVHAKTKQSKYFASFWVEGISITWLLISLVLSVYF